MADMEASGGPQVHGPSERFLDVELVEDPGGSPHAGGAAPGAPAEPNRRAPGLVSRWWWRVAISLAVVLTAISVIADHRDAARLASLADVAGVVAPMNGPPHARWSTTVGVWSAPIETAGRIVFATTRPDRGTDVVAIDAGSGTEDWRTPLDAPAADTTASLTSTCVAVAATGRPVRPLVACLAGLFVYGGSGGSTSSVTASSAHLELIDVASDRILIGGATTGWTVLSADGAPIRTSDPAVSSGRLAGFTGRYLFSESTSSTIDAPRTDVLDLTTGRSFAIAGGLAGPSPDDRSLPDLVLTRSRDSLVATDIAMGAARWSTPLRVRGQGSTFLRGGGQVMVVDGQVVVDDARSVRVLDGRSGTVVWERRHAAPVDRGAVTDGTVVVTVATTSDRSATMTAYGLADGVQRWTLSVPPLTQQLTTLGRHLAVLTPGRITVWG